MAQSLEGLQVLFQKVTDLGKPPSQKWCQAAFENFDVEESGKIHVESWCEIVRIVSRSWSWKEVAKLEESSWRKAEEVEGNRKIQKLNRIRFS